MILRTVFHVLAVLRSSTLETVGSHAPKGVPPSGNEKPGKATAQGPGTPQPPLGTVTVLFCDVVNSTALSVKLSPPAFGELLERFFHTARDVVERHGGAIRDVFPGDRFMAVFGTPVQGVDDALRAVEAAAELRDAVAKLSEELRNEREDVGLDLRTAVNTGEAVVIKPLGGSTAVIGDAVNVGAFLQQAADQGEILIGSTTYELVREFVRVKAVPPIAIPGLGAPVVAWQLLEVNREGVERSPGPVTTLVGREREFTLLRWSYERMVDQRSCHLVNVLGESGVGKSRLIEEFVHTLGENAKVLRGRCLPYGDGITYKPIEQIIRQAAEIQPTDSDQQVRARIAQLAQNDRRIAARLERLLSPSGILGDPKDTFRAVRRVLERLAERHGLVLIIDDLQEAQAPSLDAIARLVVALRDAPALIVCMARSEFFDHRENWGSSIADAASVKLRP